MRLTLIVPFDSGIRLDRKWVTYDAEIIHQYLENKRKILAASQMDLGRYLLPDLGTQSFYRDTIEPGLAYEAFFLARWKIKAQLIEKITTENNFLTKTQKAYVDWIDNGIGVLVFSTELVTDSLSDATRTGTSRKFLQNVELNEFGFDFFKGIKQEIQRKTKQLLALPHVEKHHEKSKLSEHCPMWVHAVWQTNAVETLAPFENLISANTLNNARRSRQSFWGWGDSIYLSDSSAFSYADKWLLGMGLAQYFHARFDGIFRRFPLALEVLREQAKVGRLQEARTYAERFSYEANLALIEFDQARLTLAGEARKVFVSLLDLWETLEFSNGIRSQLPYLSELSKQGEKKIVALTQTTIEFILFFSAIVGLAGLSISVHDYLNPEKKRFGIVNLANLELFDPLFIASLMILFLMAVFSALKIGFLPRLWLRVDGYIVRQLRRFRKPGGQ